MVLRSCEDRVEVFVFSVPLSSSLDHIQPLSGIKHLPTSCSKFSCYETYCREDRAILSGPFLHRSLSVTNNYARRSKLPCLSSSHIRTPLSFHSSNSSLTNGLRYTSMSLSGYFGPWISTDIIINFCFMHIQPRRLNMHRVIGQVL
jgi:hypothetical protein